MVRQPIKVYGARKWHRHVTKTYMQYLYGENYVSQSLPRNTMEKISMVCRLLVWITFELCSNVARSTLYCMLYIVLKSFTPWPQMYTVFYSLLLKF